MDTTSAAIEDEVLSTFKDVFYQFKAYSSHFHKLQVIWYLRLFVKCSTITILLLLGMCHYENGIFDNIEFSGLHSAVLFICMCSSIRQIMRNRRREAYFKGASDAFETVTKELSKWYNATKSNFAKILILLLEEMSNDTNIDIKTNEFISLILFDAVIWFTNITCLFINVFYPSQFYYTVLSLFVLTLVTVAMENLLVGVKGIQHSTNENIAEKIDKIKWIINIHKDDLDNTDDSSGKMEAETSETSIITKNSEESSGEKAHLEKSLNFLSNHEQKNEISNEKSQIENSFESHNQLNNSENEFVISLTSDDYTIKKTDDSNAVEKLPDEKGKDGGLNNESILSENQDTDPVENDKKDDIYEENYNSTTIENTNLDSRKSSTAQNPESLTNNAQVSNVFPIENQEQNEKAQMDQNSEILEIKTPALQDENNDLCEESSRSSLEEGTNTANEMHIKIAQQLNLLEKDNDSEVIEKHSFHNKKGGLNDEFILSENQNSDLENEISSVPEDFLQHYVKNDGLNEELISSKNQEAHAVENDEKNDMIGQNLNSSLIENENAESENLSAIEAKKLSVSEKDENGSAASDGEVPGSSKDEKYVENKQSDFNGADDNGDLVHFTLTKCANSHKTHIKPSNPSEMKISSQNKLKIIEKGSPNTEHDSDRKIALTYGKFHFSMDLQPESEIDLVFNMSGKSMKRPNRKMIPYDLKKRCKKE